MGKFDGLMICTDLDGTLLRNDGTISEENKRAVLHFQQEGGIFTFITGRMPFFVADMYEAIRPNAPIGCINGGGLYNYPEQKYVWTCPVPSGVMALVRMIDEQFPSVGIQVNTFYATYFCKENHTMKEFRRATGLPNRICSYMEIEEPIAKILFGCEDEDEIMGVARALAAHPLAAQFDFVRSEKKLYEILPPGIGKGTAIIRLAEYLGLNLDKTIAIGDYDNDISMFRAAKWGIAVANACPGALQAADAVTVRNEEHAIAHVIKSLEQGAYGM